MDFLNSMRYPSPQLSKRYGLFILVGVLCLAPWVCVFTGGNYWVRVLDFALLYVFLALGLNIVVGFAGLLDLGYIAFYAVGAYAAGLLAYKLLDYPANSRTRSSFFWDLTWRTHIEVAGGLFSHCHFGIW